MAVAAAATGGLTELLLARAPALAVAYDVLLLHGTAVELTESLPVGIDEGDSVHVRGEDWTVAAVRRDRPARPQLVCVRGL
jgi:hypothetical protein